jgi:hypothetical protein
MAYLTIKDDVTGTQLYRAPIPPYGVPPWVGQLVTFITGGSPTTRQVMSLTTNTTITNWDYIATVSEAPSMVELTARASDEKPPEELTERASDKKR